MMSRPCGSSGPSTRLGGAGTRGASAQMAGLARALCVLAVCGHARASSPGVNATNATCPTKLSEQQQRPFAKVFFDQGCVAVMAPRSDGTCPIETLDTFTARYFGPNATSVEHEGVRARSDGADGQRVSTFSCVGA